MPPAVVLTSKKIPFDSAKVCAYPVTCYRSLNLPGCLDVDGLGATVRGPPIIQYGLSFMAGLRAKSFQSPTRGTREKILRAILRNRYAA
jgi:hypothetical protein